MRCLICHTPDDARPRRGTNDFEALFGDLIRGKPDYSWWIDSGGYSPWLWPPDWIDDEERLDAIDAQLDWPVAGGSIASTPFLGQYMQYLLDDWVDIYGFPHRPSAIDLKRDTHWRVNGLPQMIDQPRGATHLFANVDGSMWALLCGDDRDLEAAARKWTNSEYVTPEMSTEAT